MSSQLVPITDELPTEHDLRRQLQRYGLRSAAFAVVFAISLIAFLLFLTDAGEDFDNLPSILISLATTLISGTFFFKQLGQMDGIEAQIKELPARRHEAAERRIRQHPYSFTDLAVRGAVDFPYKDTGDTPAPSAPATLEEALEQGLGSVAIKVTTGVNGTGRALTHRVDMRDLYVTPLPDGAQPFVLFPEAKVNADCQLEYLGDKAILCGVNLPLPARSSFADEVTAGECEWAVPAEKHE